MKGGRGLTDGGLTALAGVGEIQLVVPHRLPAVDTPDTRFPHAEPVPLRGAVDSRLRRAWFGLRATRLRLLRGMRNLGEAGATAPRRAPAAQADWPVTAGVSRTPLWTGGGAEWKLTAGKVQNLRVAARRLDGVVIPAGAVFSFWRALGRPTPRRGYVAGRELREGCMVASVGGGLCQLSNALYAAALEAGMQIVERHAHSRIVPGSLAERGLDATVFWNYIDLRFRAPAGCRLEVNLSAGHLEVRLRTRESRSVSAPAFRVVSGRAVVEGGRSRQEEAAHDCIACANQDCAEYIASRHHAARTAWLLDEMWPEFNQWLAGNARAGDLIALPLDGARRGRAAYAWDVRSHPQLQVIEHPLLAVARGLTTRFLGPQGAARQRGLLRLDAALARAGARDLVPEADHAVVSLNLLVHLWPTGMLAGRRLTVLLNRSPLAMLHAQLDRARSLHPQSATLGDFRADEELVAAEEAALRAADVLVTPHCAVAQFARRRYGARIEQPQWLAPSPSPAHAMRGGGVLFPASALGRKGAYELREACRRLKLPLRVLGRAQEDAAFWQGMDARMVDGRDMWCDVACVALPAFVEHRPRLLLQARARGLPVVCSTECGLPEDWAGVTAVNAGAVPELMGALLRVREAA